MDGSGAAMVFSLLFGASLGYDRAKSKGKDDKLVVTSQIVGFGLGCILSALIPSFISIFYWIFAGMFCTPLACVGADKLSVNKKVALNIIAGSIIGSIASGWMLIFSADGRNVYSSLEPHFIPIGSVDTWRMTLIMISCGAILVSFFISFILCKIKENFFHKT